MFIAEKMALDELIREMKEIPIFYEKVLEIIVFGSRVRGDFTGESDFDVLVIVKDKDVVTETGLIGLFGKKEDYTGIPFSVVVKDKQTYDREKRFRTGFALGIEDEEITIIRDAKKVRSSDVSMEDGHRGPVLVHKV